MNNLDNLGKIYNKLKSFLRAVPVIWDREYGYLPKDARLWRTNPEDERYPYRLARMIGTGHPVIILFHPTDTEYEHPQPTFEQFLDAYQLMS